MASRVDNIKPLGIKRLNVRNNHHTLETDKKVAEMRKHSYSVLHSYDKDIEEMREKYGRLQTRQTVRTPEPKPRKSPEPRSGPITPVKRPTSRPGSLRVSSSKPQSRSASDLTEPGLSPRNGVSVTKSIKAHSPKTKKASDTSNNTSVQPGQTFPRGRTSAGGSVKRRPGSVKKKASEADINGQKRISHSYCEKIVYDSETGETISDGGYLIEPRRPRSTSMFDTDHSEEQTAIPIIEDREMNRIMEEREAAVVGGVSNGRRPSRKRSITLDEALLQLGDNCPYKDLIS